MGNEKNLVEHVLFKLASLDTSINPMENHFPPQEIITVLDEIAEELGFSKLLVEPQRWDENQKDSPLIYSFIYYKQGANAKKPVVLFLGHHDVVPVPPAELSEWKHDPFIPQKNGDMITGRGVLDMKGAVAAYFTAFSNVTLKQGTVIIAISGDEEVGGTRSMPNVITTLEKHDLMPDYVINGEPSFTPVIVTKRRGLTLLKVQFPLEWENATGILKTIHFKSSQGNGSDTLHSALFTLGSDSHAMFTAGKLANTSKIVSMETSSQKTNSVPKTVSITFLDDSIDADPSLIKEYKYSKGLTKILQAIPSLPSLSWPIEKSLFGISIGPNVYKQNKETGELFIDIRSMMYDSQTHEKIRELVERHFKEFLPDSKVILLNQVDSMINTKKTNLPLIMKTIALKHKYPIASIGEKLGGASDSRYFTAKGIPTVELGPQGKNAHGPNECVKLSSLQKIERIYKELALTLLQTQ